MTELKTDFQLRQEKRNKLICELYKGLCGVDSIGKALEYIGGKAKCHPVTVRRVLKKNGLIV